LDLLPPRRLIRPVLGHGIIEDGGELVPDLHLDEILVPAAQLKADQLGNLMRGHAREDFDGVAERTLCEMLLLLLFLVVEEVRDFAERSCSHCR
jgi:hypothetical protein